MVDFTAESSGTSITQSDQTRSRAHNDTASPKKDASVVIVDADADNSLGHGVDADPDTNNLKLADEENLVRGDVVIRDGEFEWERLIRMLEADDSAGHDVARYVVSTQDDGDPVLTLRSFIIGSGKIL